MGKFKRITAYVLAALMATGSLAGCGTTDKNIESDDSPEVITEGTLVSSYSSKIITLGNYKGVEIEAIDTEPTEEEVQEEINSILSQSQTVEDTGKTVVENGDIVDLDYVGTLDGEEFDSKEGYYLEIGSGAFIDGFEDGLIGTEVGQEVTLELTFPEEYPYNEDLAGQDTVFQVTVNAIVKYVIPEWTDEFAREHGYDSADAYEEDIRSSLREKKEKNAADDREYAVLSVIIEDSEFDLVEEEVQSIIDNINDVYEYYADAYGMDLETFVAYYFGVEMEEYESEVRAGAVYQIEYSLLALAVAKEEGIEMTEEEYEEDALALAQDVGYETLEEFEEAYEKNVIEESLLIDKVVEYLVGLAVEV